MCFYPAVRNNTSNFFLWVGKYIYESMVNHVEYVHRYVFKRPTFTLYAFFFLDFITVGKIIITFMMLFFLIIRRCVRIIRLTSLPFACNRGCIRTIANINYTANSLYERKKNLIRGPFWYLIACVNGFHRCTSATFWKAPVFSILRMKMVSATRY